MKKENKFAEMLAHDIKNHSIIKEDGIYLKGINDEVRIAKFKIICHNCQNKIFGG